MEGRSYFSFLLLEGSLRYTLRPLALPYLSDNNTSPVPGLAEDRREREVSLCMGALAAPEPHEAVDKVHAWWGCTSLSSTVGAASPLIPALPMRGRPWGFLVHCKIRFHR